MTPDLDTLFGAWPLIAGIAALWARLEVALSRARDQSKSNERAIAELDAEFEAAIKEIRADAKQQQVASNLQAVQLGRIEASLAGFGKSLERIEKAIAK